MSDYRALVEFIVRNIVDNPDAVVVELHPDRGRSETVEIHLHPDDVGRVIGKSGRNIEAIRAVVKAAAIKEHHRVGVEVVTDDGRNGAATDAYEPDEQVEEFEAGEPIAEVAAPAEEPAE